MTQQYSGPTLGNILNPMMPSLGNQGQIEAKARRHHQAANKMDQYMADVEICLNDQDVDSCDTYLMQLYKKVPNKIQPREVTLPNTGVLDTIPVLLQNGKLSLPQETQLFQESGSGIRALQSGHYRLLFKRSELPTDMPIEFMNGLNNKIPVVRDGNNLVLDFSVSPKDIGTNASLFAVKGFNSVVGHGLLQRLSTMDIQRR